MAANDRIENRDMQQLYNFFWTNNHTTCCSRCYRTPL